MFFSCNNFPTDPRYYDAYIYNTSNVNTSIRILGDATGELGPIEGSSYMIYSSFFSNRTYMPTNTAPLFIRGDSQIQSQNPANGTDGLFGAISNDAYVYMHTGFRIVLTP